MNAMSLFESIQPRYPEFADEVALITGSSRGIGKGIALRLAREKMKIVIHGVDSGEVDQTTNELRAFGINVLGVQADFSHDEEISRVFQTTLDQFGRLDLLVNNAADLRRKHLLEVDTALLDHELAVNLRAPYLCAQRAIEIMRPTQHGNVINISSVGGARAHWAGLPYDVTKGAIDAMTRAMALDAARMGIRVNAIAPGAIKGERTPPPDDTRIKTINDRIPLGHMGLALDIGAAVAFLASTDASYITGQILYVDGGATVQLSPPGQPI